MKITHFIAYKVASYLPLFFAAHNAVQRNWGAAIFFLGIRVLTDLAEVNGRLQSIQRKALP